MDHILYRLHWRYVLAYQNFASFSEKTNTSYIPENKEIPMTWAGFDHLAISEPETNTIPFYRC